ncbi:MAG: RluA family pseudouridine synthase [Actinomycetota bacterium]|nr:RluA family pseudouridine synthase [Actinomycetota bacterium]
MTDLGPMTAGDPGSHRVRAEVSQTLAGERLDRVIALLWDLPRRQVAALVTSGAVSVSGRVAAVRAHRVVDGDVIEVDLADTAAPTGVEPDPSIEVAVVAIDDQVIVVDKPAGLLVHPGSGHPTGTLVHGLVARWPEIAAVGEPLRPGIVHRLDSGTSGLLVVARTPAAYTSLVAQLAARTVARRYLALVWGRVEAPVGLIDAPVGRSQRDRTQMAVSADGREARTRYEVVSRHDEPAPVTLVACGLETGRTHQVRVHLAAIGHPVVGDVRYGGTRPQLRVSRPFLHAFELGFDHPATGEHRCWTSPLPPDLEDVRELLH